MAMSRSFGDTSFTTRSPMRISPPVASSSPAIIRSAVVLPHPDGPTNTKNSLSWIWRLTWLTATTSLNSLVRSLSVTLAIVSVLLFDELIHVRLIDHDRVRLDDRADLLALLVLIDHIDHL